MVMRISLEWISWGLEFLASSKIISFMKKLAMLNKKGRKHLLSSSSCIIVRI